MNGVLEFYDTSDVVCMNQAEHFMATDVEWDPTGRYVATSVSWWAHKVSITLHFECASVQSFFNGEHKVSQDPKTWNPSLTSVGKPVRCVIRMRLNSKTARKPPK